MEKSTILKLQNKAENFLKERENQMTSQTTPKNYFKLNQSNEKNLAQEEQKSSQYETSFLDNVTENMDTEKYLEEIEQNTWNILPKLKTANEENITEIYRNDDYVDSIPYVRLNQLGMSFSRELLIFLDKQGVNLNNIQVKPEPRENILIVLFTNQNNQNNTKSSAFTKNNIVTYKRRVNRIIDTMNVSRNVKYEVSYNYSHNALIVNFNKKIKELI